MYALRDTSTGELHTCPLKRSLIIGSSDDADIRLATGSAAPEHARITCLEAKSGQRSLKVQDLDSELGTRVNGELIAQARMNVGDILDIAGHSLTFEEVAVASISQEQDEVSESDRAAIRVAPVRSSRVRSAEPAPADKAQSRKIIIAVITGGLLLVLGVMFWTRSQDVLPSNWFEARRLYERSKFVEADRILDGFERDWAHGDPERLSRIDSERKRQRRFAELLEDGRKKLIASSAGVARVAQIDALREQQSTGDPVESQVAKLLLSKLEDLRVEGQQLHDQVAAERWLQAKVEEEKAALAAAQRLAQESDRDAAARKLAADRKLARATADKAAAAQDLESEGAEGDASPAGLSDSVVFGIAEQAVKGGQYAQAVEIFREMLVTGSELEVPAVKNGLVVAIQQARTGLDASIEEARTVAMKGDAASLAAAESMLTAALAKTPASAEMNALVQQANQLQSRFAQRLLDLQVPVDDSTVLERKQREGLQKEARAAYREAAQAYGDASGVASQFNRELAEFLKGKASDCFLLAEITDLILAGIQNTSPMRVILHSGRPVEIASVSSDRLVSEDGEEVLVSELSLDSIDRLLADTQLSPRQKLSTGLLAYRRKDRVDAEKRIAAAVSKDKSLLPLARGIVERGREDFLAPAELVVIRGRLIPDIGRKQEEQIEDLAAEIKRIRGRNADSWLQGLDELLIGGPDQIDILIPALRLRIDEELSSAEKHGFAAHYAAMRELRLELDRARAEALELIRSEQEYFFPFQPPATTLARQSEYLTIQAEVDQRVFAVQALWDKTVKAQGPNQSLQESFQRIEWMSEVLESLGEQTTDIEYRLRWWRSLPAEIDLDLHSFCFDLTERQEREKWFAVREENVAVLEGLSAEEAALARLTNEYRVMFGLNPLALSAALSRAARSHAEEMVTRNTFSHFSSHVDRVTVFQRAEAAGYSVAASENIMTGSAAAEVLRSWARASAQHRNILWHRHRDFGIGQVEGHWVQVFGRGKSESANPAGDENR